MDLPENASLEVRCRCGRTHDTEAFVGLNLVGYMTNGKASAGEVLEIRRCACGSGVSLDFGTEPDTTPHLPIRRLRAG